MTDKITSIAGLKKAVDDRRWYYQAEGRSAIGSILKLISEFEASVRDDKIWEDIDADISNAEHCEPILVIHYLNLLRKDIEKLRRILGGEGERRG